MRLPFKEYHQLLPDNFQVAKSRLTHVFKRLKSNPRLLSQYQHVIEDQLSQGIIEEVVEPSRSIVGEVHYLPHHEVVRKDKETSKLRVVYYASLCAEKRLTIPYMVVRLRHH